MKSAFRRTSRLWVTLGLSAVAAIALLPGSWRAAVAQTSGAFVPASTATSTTTATATSTTTSTATSKTTSTATSTTTSTATSTATFTAIPTATSTTLPTAGGTVTVPNAGITLNFGQGALGANTKVDFKPMVSAPVAQPTTTAQQTQQAQQTNQAAVQALAQQNVPPPPLVVSGGGIIQSLFQLDATNVTNNANVTTFNAPVTLAIVVPPDTLSLAGGNLANVQVFRFSETTRAWVQVACTTGPGGLSCSTSGFSIWALIVTTQFAAAPGALGAGATPLVPRPAATGTGLSTDDSMSLLSLAGLVLMAGGLAGAGAYTVRRQRS